MYSLSHFQSITLPWCCGRDPDEALVLEQLFEILDATYPARNKWFNLGGVLSLPTSDLKAIKKDGDDAGECLREMLELRLKKLPALTWARIVAALRSTVVAEQTLAKRVEDDKCLLGNHGNGTEMDGKGTSVI